jgi:hypothetical protein
MNKYVSRNECQTNGLEKEINDYLDVVIDTLMSGKVAKKYIRDELRVTILTAIKADGERLFLVCLPVKWVKRRCRMYKRLPGSTLPP